MKGYNVVGISSNAIDGECYGWRDVECGCCVYIHVWATLCHVEVDVQHMYWFSTKVGVFVLGL